MKHWAVTDPAAAQPRPILRVLAQDDAPEEGGLLVTELVGWAGWPALQHAGAALVLNGSQAVVQDNRTLEQAKQARIAAMKLKREQAIVGTFVWDGSTFVADDKSQTRLMGLKVTAGDPDFQPENWLLADGTWRLLSATDALAVWAALKSHIRTQFIVFGARQQAILAATTVAEVDAVTWEA